MVLDCGVIVTDLVENGLSVAHGVRPGDEIRQVCGCGRVSDWKIDIAICRLSIY